MTSQGQDERVSANPPDVQRPPNRGRCLAFIIVVFIFPILVLFFLPYLGFFLLTMITPFINLILFELVICLGILIVVFALGSHPNWTQAIRRHFLGKENRSHSTRTQISHTTHSPAQYSFDTHASQPILIHAPLDSSSDSPDIKIWPTDVLPLNTVIQRLPTLESLVDELQEIIEYSSLQFNEISDINREALLIKREATNLLLSSLIRQLKKKSIPLAFYLQKRKNLVKTLQNIEVALGDYPELAKAKPSSLEKSES